MVHPPQQLNEMATDLTLVDFLFDDRPQIKIAFGNRRNWHRFCALADSMAAELAIRRTAG